MRIPTRSGLLQEPCQDGSVLRIEEVATPGKQATDAHGILGHLVATHGTIAFFDPPADGTLKSIIGAIKRFSCGSFPRAVPRQAMPQVPARKSTRAAGDRLNFGALLRVVVRLLDSASAWFPVPWPAPVVDS